MNKLTRLLRYVLGIRCTGCLYGMPELGGLKNWSCRGHAARLKRSWTISESVARGMRDGERSIEPYEADRLRTAIRDAVAAGCELRSPEEIAERLGIDLADSP